MSCARTRYIAGARQRQASWGHCPFAPATRRLWQMSDRCGKSGGTCMCQVSLACGTVLHSVTNMITSILHIQQSESTDLRAQQEGPATRPRSPTATSRRLLVSTLIPVRALQYTLLPPYQFSPLKSILPVLPTGPTETSADIANRGVSHIRYCLPKRYLRVHAL